MITKLIVLSISIFAIARFLPGVKLKSFWTAMVVALVYSLVNFFLYTLLSFISLPFIVLTFGLFIFVINAFLLWLTDKLIDDFAIDSLKTTLIAAVLITLINTVLNWLL
ncbi:MAG: putative membrane protein [Alteromonadaceae bacterium]|jgi:putative membrane protein